jgi:phosphoglycolate phosphatase-like HAD superfamily hydrolase
MLWDVDGTLVRAGPIGRDVFGRAVAHVLGQDPGEHGVVMGGKTDPQIALEILATMTLDGGEADGHLPGILERLEDELRDGAELMRAHGRVLPGVREVLATLDAEPGAVQSLLTGNIAANAAAKLAAFDLDGWFDWRLGAFGSDHRDRRELVPIAVERMRGLHGAAPDEVWVVGDTPRDLACAQTGGARCLLVATGSFTYEELTGLGADVVVHDLRDTATVVDTLLGRVGA